ncbi:hypothetical protein SNE40_004013 [Patella caerulea]|uniref:Tyr recombinase domain-containing protein n=1 Tax=Patella caerulea TaxID=87958 RepID=A0AAN8KJK3_PATCE
MASDPKDLLLCPCRALDAYIDRTQNLRSNESQLFITYQEGYHKPAAKSSLSRWIVSLLKYVYKTRGRDLPVVRAHDTRKMSTSWALFNGAPLEDILKAAHWASDNTFTTFYLKDVPTSEASFARSSILLSSRQKKV